MFTTYDKRPGFINYIGRKVHYQTGILGQCDPPVTLLIMSNKSPPPLMKKHSQTDLVSRLKTRKMLGVGGEDDDGEIHRSKISQMLGNEMKFGVREPIGLRIWIFMSAVLFTTIAFIALAFPSQLYEFVFEIPTTRISIRLCGGALLSVSLIMWKGLYTAEKAIIQWTLLTEACLFTVQFLVTSITLVELGLLSNSAIVLLLSEVLFLIVTLVYYFHLGRRTKKTQSHTYSSCD
ncbi:hypothetical protein DPEC_G00249730 [Dallia pectoralis]|uniref:Uncharacterized protein n=1 Tax=Dallia pectoralis TaxID=75939 RepID=A0ACC2FSY0_DALPE|nr:hypothetical protein DPEC_G00249730 [Dallia pectoralis]